MLIVSSFFPVRTQLVGSLSTIPRYENSKALSTSERISRRSEKLPFHYGDKMSFLSAPFRAFFLQFNQAACEKFQQ